MWQIKQETGDPQTGATNLMQQMECNSVVNILKALAMNKEIQKVMEKRFDLAQARPLPPPLSAISLATMRM